ncbi:DNA cytosine methyltransferase [Pseudophaeobacter arcticus]|jgi:DNA (cytosine-5)-methyltransferase 1|uniref:DNA cytosine methyltransferase n=1 Tax=Pseudophaeobacter arcticus TaxID=385492 RepID=UPI002490D42A|nr:DNA cytosine methyltransferase [Pseudophaeobacter arcticus]
MERTHSVALHSPNRSNDLLGISLCAGVGGLDLGLHLAEPGYRTVCYVERNSFAAATLVARMADTSLASAPIWDDLKSFDGKPWRGRVHIISAGYPCQPFTLSGVRKGEDDPRHLWPDVARIVDEVRPEWCFFENVVGHLTLGLQDVVRDLQSVGYSVAARVQSAAEVGGSHIRQRLFILAHANGQTGRQQDINPNGAKQLPLCGGPESDRRSGFTEDRGNVLDCDVGIIDRNGVAARPPGLFPPMPGDFAGWGRTLERESVFPAQPCLQRLDDGVACGVDRSAAAGNGVVPMAAARAFVELKKEFPA